jgi:hypothetical protein
MIHIDMCEVIGGRGRGGKTLEKHFSVLTKLTIYILLCFSGRSLLSYLFDYSSLHVSRYHFSNLVFTIKKSELK